MAQGDNVEFPTLKEPEKSIFSKTQRGKPLLRDSFHYEYTLNKQFGEKKFWVCTRHRSTLHPRCPGRATTDGDMTTSTRQHNHFSDATLNKVRDEENKILQMAVENPTLKTSHLLKEWAKKTMSPAERSKAMKRHSMRRKLQRRKTTILDHPPLPNSFDDLVDLPEKFKNTFDGERFLLFNDEVEGGRMIIFGSCQGLIMLQRSETWSCDGTFGCVPAPFYQLYSFMAELNHKSYPCFFALLPDKRAATYKKMLEVLKESVERKGALRLTQV
jgi:hypothetical protein